MKHSEKIAGFTLLEITLVLVALSMMTVALISSESVIRAAKMRSVITDIQRFETAVNAFTVQYRAKPGDTERATLFWLDCTDDGANLCNGNGDGVISSSATEGLRAWQHLTRANILPGAYSGILDDNYVMSGAYDWQLDMRDLFVGTAHAKQQKFDICHNGHTINVAEPAVLNAHLEHGDTIGSCEGTGGESDTEGLSNDGKFTIGWNVPPSDVKGGGYKMDWNNVHLITFAAERVPYLDGAIVKPFEAKSIDNKMDDGKASSGFVLAADGADTSGCITLPDYNLVNTDIVCQMHFVLK